MPEIRQLPRILSITGLALARYRFPFPTGTSQYQLSAACLGVSTPKESPRNPASDLALLRISGLWVFRVAYWEPNPGRSVLSRNFANVTFPRKVKLPKCR